MGGHDSITEGGWEWMDGSPFRYIRWSDGTFYFLVYFKQFLLPGEKKWEPMQTGALLLRLLRLHKSLEKMSD